MEAPNVFFTTISETWEKVHADIISHVVAFILIFYAGGVTFPLIELPIVDAKIITNNSWFHLAKEMNLLFLGPILIIVALVAYIAILHLVGEIAGKLFTRSRFSAKSINRIVNYVNRPSYEFIALSLGKENFTIADILQKFAELTFFYQVENKQEFKLAIKQNVARKSAADIYSNNALIFLLVWIIIFIVLPKTNSWLLQNQGQFWLVLLFLGIFYFWAKIRSNIIEQKSLTMHLSTIVLFMKKNKDLDIRLQNEHKKTQVKERLDEILNNYRNFQPPSLTAHLLNKLKRKPPFSRIRTPKIVLKLTKNSRLLYDTGNKFQSAHEILESKWLIGYIAFRYYKLCIQWKILKFRITGVFEKNDS